MTMRFGTTVLAAVTVLSVSSFALGDEKGKDPKQRGVITLDAVTITGRIQKPIASVDVNRIAPKLTLAELRQPFIDRIEQAIYKDPF
jgi:hypothetical protein